MTEFAQTDLGDTNDAKPIAPDVSDRKDRIIYELESGPISAYELATILDCPAASVRRTVQALRAEGFVINDARDNNGLYRLVRAA